MSMFIRNGVLPLFCLIISLTPAYAQFDHRGGLFAPLFSLFSRPEPRALPMEHPRDRFRALQHVPHITVRPPARENRDWEDEQPERALGSRAFCVRLCDGFYFPVGMAAGGRTAQAQASACARMCPASQVALYSLPLGGEVTQATGPQGQSYAMLPTAFRFRTEISSSCTCNGRPGGGLAAVDLADDFTLRRGDLVAGESGPLIFTGGGKLPFQATQFTPARPRQVGQATFERFVRAPRVMAAAGPTSLPHFEENAGKVEAPKGQIRIIPLSVAASLE